MPTTTSPSAAARMLVPLLALAGLAALIAGGCGNSGSTTTPPPAATGFLRLTISGLPGGADASVTVEGQGSFVRQVVASGVVDDVPEGDCTITADEVAVAPDDTFGVQVLVRTVTIVAGDTTSLEIEYESTTVDPGEFEFALFHGPVVFQGCHSTATYTPLGSPDPPTPYNETDTFAFPYGAGYVLDGCTITGNDVTGTGIAASSSLSDQFGAADASASVTVDEVGMSVTLSASASGTCSYGGYVGSGAASGSLPLGYAGTGNLMDLVLAISNPDGSPFDVVFTWSYEGDRENPDYSSWVQRFTYQIDPQVCGSNPQPLELFWGRSGVGATSDGGTLTVPLSGTSHLIGFGIQNTASGAWSMGANEIGASGSANSESSVTISIVR